jgi:hypothetical protein
MKSAPEKGPGESGQIPIRWFGEGIDANMVSLVSADTKTFIFGHFASSALGL